MILDIDVGNTTLKWRLMQVSTGRVIAGRVLPEVKFLEHLHERFDVLSMVRIACVAADSVLMSLCESIFQLWGLQAHVARVAKKFAALEVVYSEPSRLGVDRWLAMLAAYELSGRSVCVIDCGSAITLDLVDSKGMHQGGYIVPGLHMQKNSLLKSTGQIRIMDEQALGDIGWGCCTEEAINAGVLRMVGSFVDAIVADVRVMRPETDFFITGGDADTVLSVLGNAKVFSCRPDLVMDGLAIVFPE